MHHYEKYPLNILKSLPSQQSKMQTSSSDHHFGHFGYHENSGTCFKIDICPDFLMAGLAASGAAAFFWIYQAITVKAAAGRRKRSFQNFITSHDFDHVIDFFIAGKFYANPSRSFRKHV